MIHSFSFKNFYSFAEDNTVSFVVNDKVPNNNNYFMTTAEVRLSKIATVIGSNASGKTNLLKILPFLKWIIVDSFSMNPSDTIPIKPFLLSNLKNELTELSVDFEIDGDVFTYLFKLNGQRILHEELQIKNKTKKKKTKKILFSRQWETKTKKYIFLADKFDLPKEFAKLLRSNASVVGTAMRLNHEMSKKIGKFWKKVKTNVTEAGWIGDSFPNSSKNLIETLDFYSENEILKKEAEKLLARFDLGLETFNIKKEKKENGFLIDVEVIHSFGSQKCALPFQYESAGTKQLFILLKTILQVLAYGGVAVLDEFDVNLHPEMVLALYELFISKETNPNNAQLMFSTHSHRILNELEKYQIFLIEKNELGASEVWRLDDMSGVRADDNYYTKYIAGAYGAVPRIE